MARGYVYVCVWVRVGGWVGGQDLMLDNQYVLGALCWCM